MLYSKRTDVTQFHKTFDAAYADLHSIRCWYYYEIRKMESGVWRVAPLGWSGVEQPNRMFRQR